jgi:NADH:ubiquinone oxidoreductase subunit 3 (subunit A)
MTSAILFIIVMAGMLFVGVLVGMFLGSDSTPKRRDCQRDECFESGRCEKRTCT